MYMYLYTDRERERQRESERERERETERSKYATLRWHTDTSMTTCVQGRCKCCFKEIGYYWMTTSKSNDMEAKLAGRGPSKGITYISWHKTPIRYYTMSYQDISSGKYIYIYICTYVYMCMISFVFTHALSPYSTIAQLFGLKHLAEVGFS